jgi:hypothetical protein
MLRVLLMSVGDIVTLGARAQWKTPTEKWKIVAERLALPAERGPFVLRLESTSTGARKHDIPSAWVTTRESIA